MVLITLLLVLGLTCASDVTNLPWETDQYGRFHTRDIERAQEELPFVLVIPSYLPGNLGEYPLIVGPLRGAWPENKLRVEVTFQAEDVITEGLVSIIETDYPVHPPDPDSNPGYTYIEIAGYEVVEGEHTIGFLSPGGTIDIPGFIFWWAQNDFFFEIGIYGYDRNEAIKIIESMIQQ